MNNIPGAVSKEFRGQYSDKAYSSVFMPKEELTVNLFKDVIKSNVKSNEPILCIECVADSKQKLNNLPNYLSEIIDNYKAKKV